MEINLILIYAVMGVPFYVKFINFKNIPENELRSVVSTIIFCQTDRSLLRVPLCCETPEVEQRPFTMRGDWERDSANSKLSR